MRERSEHLPLTVTRRTPRLVCVLAVALLSVSVVATSQTPVSGKSGERLALQRGQEAIKNRDLAGARAEFEKAVRLAPHDAEAQSALGWVLAQQGELDAAVVHLKAAIRARPGFVDARLTLVGVLGQQGKPAEAEQEVRAAVRAAPGHAEAHRMLG
jgi:Tfp pilus assembly protein PilF